MNLSQWFNNQLQASADGFVWGAEQVPVERRFLQPPAELGEWSAARHVFHMVYYDQNFALPGMQQWLGGPGVVTHELDEGAAWSNAQDVERLLMDFREARSAQIALLSRFDDKLWNETRETIWGPKTLLWVVSKTFQHTCEHTDGVLRIALFWDFFAA
jgi:hypothetical protein